MFKRATNYVLSRTKQAAYDATISLTRSAIDYADRNYNPVTIYNNITNPHSYLPEWQADALAKNSSTAVTHTEFLEINDGRSWGDIAKERPSGSFGSPGGPDLEYRYLKDPANPDRIIDMRHFLVVGLGGETLGALGEVGQSFFKQSKNSAFNLQDFYSNEIGQEFFYNHYDPLSDESFTHQLNTFFDNRANGYN